MESIMQFIYLGEARLSKDRMSEFLLVSKNLAIKELSTGINMNEQTVSNEESNEYNKTSVTDEDVGEDSAPTLNEDGQNVEHQTVITKPIIRIHAANKVGKTEGGKYVCDHCDKQYKQQIHLTTHIQSAHEGVKYACNQCDYQATTLSSRKRHIQSIHEGVKHACNQCDHQFTGRGNLNRHIKSQHNSVK